MLSTDFPQFWVWLSLGLGLFATIIAFGAVNEARKMADYVRMCSDWMHENNLEALKDSRIAVLDTTLTELCDQVSSLEASHKRLRSKYSMRDLRERRNASEDDPNHELNLSTTKDKRALRLKLREKGLLK